MSAPVMVQPRSVQRPLLPPRRDAPVKGAALPDFGEVFTFGAELPEQALFGGSPTP